MMKIDVVKKDLPKNSIEIINEIKKRTGKNPYIIKKTVNYDDIEINILFEEPMCNKVIINKFILEYFEKEKPKKDINDILEHINKNMPAHKVVKLYNYDDVMYNLLSGFTIILIDGYNEVLSVETKNVLDSGINPATNEVVVKGPKDAFTENYETNLGLVRKRVKSDTLWVEEHVVGVRGKSRVAVMYMKDIADDELVKKVSEKIKNISIDVIFDSNYIIELISSNKRSVFANYLSTERPDMVTMHLLNGRIAIIVENTPYAVVIPALFVDFFHSPEDYYQKTINVNYTRVVRIIAFLLSVITPAFYIAIITYNQEAIPEALLVNFAAQRSGVPFPTIVEAILMMITFDILKEANERIPSPLGSSISIVGAIVLGEAAVNAGIVSPIMIIVIAITSISGLISPSNNIVNSLRWWRLIFMIFSAFAGLLGLLVAGFLFIIKITSIKSFGIPYLSPLAPFNKSNFDYALMLTNKRKYIERDALTAKKNFIRSKGEKKNEKN